MKKLSFPWGHLLCSVHKDTIHTQPRRRWSYCCSVSSATFTQQCHHHSFNHKLTSIPRKLVVYTIHNSVWDWSPYRVDEYCSGCACSAPCSCKDLRGCIQQGVKLVFYSWWAFPVDFCEKSGIKFNKWPSVSSSHRRLCVPLSYTFVSNPTVCVPTEVCKHEIANCELNWSVLRHRRNSNESESTCTTVCKLLYR